MEISTVKRVRLINANNEKINPDFLYTIPEWETLRDYDERVILYSKNYKTIFGKEFKEDNYKSSKRGIVKITCGKESIYRFFSAKPISADTMGLNQQSLLELGIKEGRVPVTLTNANTLVGKFLFYYHHPFHEVRVPIKLTYFFGALSIILGLLSIVLALIPLFSKS